MPNNIINLSWLEIKILKYKLKFSLLFMTYARIYLRNYFIFLEDIQFQRINNRQYTKRN